MAKFRAAAKRVVKYFLDRDVVGEQLRSNHRHLSTDQAATLKDALTAHYFCDLSYYPEPPESYLATSAGERDLADHMTNRLDAFRNIVVPWLNSVVPLRNARILEIGCGTGASTVAMAEQGAKVVGVDESAKALEVARVRFALHGVEAEVVRANAVELEKVANKREFDAIIFFAVLEHMTWEERRASLQAAWRVLRSGQHLIVIETPNRLWHTDHHTSYLPFFHWLPDEIAFAYSPFAKRETYNEIFRGMSDEARVRFARWGRGVSYHDFVLSLNIPEDQLPVDSYLQLFLRQKRRGEFLFRYSQRRRDENSLQRIAPNIHPGFLCADLDLALRKP